MTVVRRALDKFGGIEIDTAGDGFFATFAGPAGAIRCAESIIDEVQEPGISVRTGVHTSEVTRRGDRMVGVAVHVCARTMGLAGPSELLASGVVRDPVADSRIALIDRGDHTLRACLVRFGRMGWLDEPADRSTCSRMPSVVPRAMGSACQGFAD